MLSESSASKFSDAIWHRLKRLKLYRENWRFRDRVSRSIWVPICGQILVVHFVAVPSCFAARPCCFAAHGIIWDKYTWRDRKHLFIPVMCSNPGLVRQARIQGGCFGGCSTPGMNRKKKKKKKRKKEKEKEKKERLIAIMLCDSSSH